MSELWDAYDKNLNKIDNVELVRGEPIPDGMYHLVAEIIVKSEDDTYLLMQRDYNKHLGGLWELTAGGSAIKGETALDAAKRELKEETGIDGENFKELKTVISEEHKTIYVIFLCTTDRYKGEVVLQQGETIGYEWLPKEYILRAPVRLFAATRTLELIKDL